eukprot:TRINITY_DN67912_c0_g3_i1.p1 TRINITY_DN67912_c0_g3~~TRINITY_DN67912_c0_g3_i1.p1  ORF type:complete len:149 (+),score=7.26 TRINITY_DN67912_c0_g3_i1:161-607(+)
MDEIELEFQPPSPPAPVAEKERFWGSPRGSEIGCYACGVGMAACFLIGWVLFGLGLWLILRENKAKRAWEEEHYTPWWEANQCTSTCVEQEAVHRGLAQHPREIIGWNVTPGTSTVLLQLGVVQRLGSTAPLAEASFHLNDLSMCCIQ